MFSVYGESRGEDQSEKGGQTTNRCLKLRHPAKFGNIYSNKGKNEYTHTRGIQGIFTVKKLSV